MAEHNGPRRWLGRQGGLSVSQLLGPPDAEPTPVRGAEPPAVTVTHAEQDRVYLWDQGENIPHGLHHLPREPYVRLDRSHSAAEALDDIRLQYHTEFFVTWFRQWCLPRLRGIDWTYEAYVPVSGPGQGTPQSWRNGIHVLDGFEPLPPNVEWTMEVPPSNHEHSPPHAIPWIVTFHLDHGTHVQLVYVRVIFARAITEAERRRKAAHQVGELL
ncbi:hypothetical protein Rhopal_003533-T1 [Rhodotorula paludigena]|uniref:Uncharacterized protein n=1 Tax=Rhodotorula paludigena TaxID=86838 RepID=A0AAV5GME2_9BASI|nr:hypothetical protein Rhopal_003533-T1 [Rhodotorula paludigena]